LESWRSEDDKVSKGIWEAVETKVEKVGIAEAKGEKEKRRRRNKMRREREKERRK